mgnify:CR=1 FL=1
MKKLNRFFPKIWMAACFVLAAISCRRDVDELQPASFPAKPDVFIDGFSAGLNYAAFGGSVPTAFDVDRQVTYNNSEASMRFEVPDVNDPRGAYAGGVFFTSTGRDLSGFNALTFWAKASQAASIDIVGFGNDFAESRYQVSVSGLYVNSNWQKYILPIPDASKLAAERGMFFYSEGPEDGRGYTFWIDEVKFERLGGLAYPRFEILSGQSNQVDAEIGEVIRLSGFAALANLPLGVDQRVDISPRYLEFFSSDESVATVDDAGNVTVVGVGEAIIKARVGSVEAKGQLTVKSVSQTPRPQTPAPTPTQNAQDVISMYSNAYANVPVDTWNTRWQFSTAEESFIQINGDDVIRYRNLNFVGIEFSSQTIDASAMTHFHLDIWTPDPTNPPKNFKVLLVDFGPNGVFGGGDDSSHELTFTSPLLATQSWVSLDIPLSSFSGLASRKNLAQLVLSGDLPNLYLDNVYFYKDGSQATEPLTPAPTPTHSAANVISIFSDAFANVPGTNFNPNWGQATVVSQLSIAGNNTLKYAGLNYQGTQLASNLNVSGMDFLHLDFWSANSTNLNVFIISPGPVETPYALNVPTSGGWRSVDIPLSAFAPVNLNQVFQFKFEGNGDVFLDNLYFWK